MSIIISPFIAAAIAGSAMPPAPMVPALALAAAAQSATAAPATTKVGGEPMYPSWTIVQNATKSPIHKQLVAAVAAAGLVDTLNGAGPFTVFAPTDEAFDRIDPAQRASLMLPEQKEALATLLTYHVVAGRVTAKDLEAQIAAGGGTATLTTVQGSPIKVTKVNDVIELTGVNGGKSYVTQADVMQSNGVIHVVNGILVPSA